MNFIANIPKQLEFINTKKLLPNGILNNKDAKKKLPAENRTGISKKIIMPVEPKGYMKYKANDPL